MLNLIIYGTRSISSTAGSGQFACPRCCMARLYRHLHSRSYFTLYFIPLIPLWKNGEYVECQSCGGTYGVEVLELRMEDMGLPASSSGSSSSAELPRLRYDADDILPALEDPRTVRIANVRRALVLFVASLGKPSGVTIQEFRTSFKELTQTELVDQQVKQDYEQATNAGATITSFVTRQLGQETPEVKKHVLLTAARIAAADGMITSTGRDSLVQLGQALGLDQSLINTAIQNRGR